MKHFTPELYVRTQNIHDEEAIREWEGETRAYAASLQKLLPRLPGPLRRFVKECPLHDARVLSISQVYDTLSITLQPDLTGGRLVVLSYSLTRSPRVDRAVLPGEFCTEPVEWLYDEIALGRRSGAVPIFSHHILLSNGWEIALTFRRLRVTRPSAFLPDPLAAG